MELGGGERWRGVKGHPRKGRFSLQLPYKFWHPLNTTEPSVTKVSLALAKRVVSGV